MLDAVEERVDLGIASAHGSRAEGDCWEVLQVVGPRIRVVRRPPSLVSGPCPLGPWSKFALLMRSMPSPSLEKIEFGPMSWPVPVELLLTCTPSEMLKAMMLFETTLF